MRARTIIFSALLLAGVFGVPAARAANNGELVQGVSDSKVYYIEGPLKRHIKDFATFQAWSFNINSVRRIPMAELNAHPTGPQLTRLIHINGNVYYVDGGARKWVPNFGVLAYYDISLRDLDTLNPDTFARLADGGTLSAPIAAMVAGDNRIFLLDNGQRRPFKNDAVAAMWGYNRSNTPVQASAKRLPIGSTVTDLILNNGNVYRVAGGERYYIQSEDVLLYSGFNWSDLTPIGDTVFSQLKNAGTARGPVLIRTAGNGKIWMTDDGGVRHHVTSLELLYAMGYNLSSVTTVSNYAAYKFPEGSDMTRYMRAPDGQSYYIFEGVRRKFTADAANMAILGLSASDARDYGWYAMGWIAQGADMESGVTTLEGYTIPATTGLVGREQHLYLDADEESAGRTDASAGIHYYRSSVVDAAKNGMAGGYGAFGSASSPASVEQERYYITMRWNYCSWYDDAGVTRCGSFNATAKNWHRHKKVVVTNPANGRQLVASVEEAGPAIWTGRVSGLSPEAMSALDAVTDNTLNYLWAVNQNVGLGRIN